MSRTATIITMPAEGRAAAAGLALVALLTWAAMAGADNAQGPPSARPHVHGEAVLNVAVEADALYLELIAPADSLLGFERPPTRAADQAALAALRQRLAVGANLFEPIPACQPVSVEVEDPFAAADSAAADSATHDHDHDHDHAHSNGSSHGSHERTHADFVLRITFDCAEPPQGLELRVFEPFERLERVRAQFLTAGGQGAAVLTRQAPLLRW